MSDVRKKWLRAFKMYVGFGLLEAILVWFADWSEGMALLVILCMQSWLLLHFSYKKRGTRILFWMILGIPGAYVKQLAKGEYRDLFSYTSFSLEAFLVWSIFITGTAITIYFWINCKDYRAENKEMKKLKT